MMKHTMDPQGGTITFLDLDSSALDCVAGGSNLVNVDGVYYLDGEFVNAEYAQQIEAANASAALAETVEVTEPPVPEQVIGPCGRGGGPPF